MGTCTPGVSRCVRDEAAVPTVAMVCRARLAGGHPVGRYAPGLGGSQQSHRWQPPSTFTLSGTDSAAAQELLGQAFPGPRPTPIRALLHNDAVDFGSAAGQAEVERVADALQANPSVWPCNPC